MSSNANLPAVRARGLGKRFGRAWALAHLDLEIRTGEILLLAGANGSGKTTLLRLIAGLYRPSRGSLTVFGRDPLKESIACRKVLSMVAHDNYLYGRLTALETLRVWARLVGGRRRTDGELVALLEEVELAPRRDDLVAGFSAGMRKRLTLLRTRLEDPRLILLDEPFSALDVAGQELVESWIRDARAAGKTVVLASHDLARSTPLCDRAALLEGGQMSWTGAGAGLAARMAAV